MTIVLCVLWFTASDYLFGIFWLSLWYIHTFLAIITLSWKNHFIVTAESKVLERSIVFVNNSKICALPITYINIFNYLAMAPDCGVGGTSTGTITHLVINVENDELYFTIDRIKSCTKRHQLYIQPLIK